MMNHGNIDADQTAMTPTAAPSNTPSHIFAGPVAKAATAPLFLADVVAEALECVELPLFEVPEEVLEADDGVPVVVTLAVVAPAVVAPAAEVEAAAARGAVD